jgi:uncharacterized cupredoxin-like copper-binding protein
MHRKRSLSAVLCVSSLSVMVWLLSAAVGPASGKVNAQGATRVTVVTVTAGKPAELAFKLSKVSLLPAGTITFKVTNMGVAFHNFKLCTTASAASSAAKNSCVGKATATLKHGQTATLTVVLNKKGQYEYLCSVPGHAASGMKGFIGVGVKVTPTVATPAPANPAPAPVAQAPPPAPVPVDPGGGGGAGASECPPGVTIQSNGQGDQDSDETGGPSDGDGCI